MPLDVTLPELGPGIASGDVVSIRVKVGEEVAKDQELVEIETDKATVTIPSTHAGKVLKVHVAEGQTVPVGGALVMLDAVAAAAAAPPPKAAPTKPAAPPPASAPEKKPEPPPKPAATVAPAKPTPPPPRPEPVRAPVAKAEAPAPAVVAEHPAAGDQIAAGPAVRRFAREVGVDLHRVTGSGVGGRITREDVLDAVRQANEMVRTIPSGPAKPTLTDAWGPIRIERMAKIRKTIAAKMHESWSTVPRVTNFDDADVTELEKIRQSSKADYANKGIKLTSLPFVIKALAMSLKSHPLLNASLDLENDQIIYKEYINIGIAVDTDRGLVVPSLRGADKMSIPDVARALATISENVRTGGFGVEDLRGSTFTVSNLGAIGGTYSTPIINVPEVAILLVGRSRQMPIVVNDQVAIRLMMPLSLSYDHRIVDGAVAARFLNDVISYLEAPSRLLLAP